MVDTYQGGSQPRRLSKHHIQKIIKEIQTSYAYWEKIKKLEEERNNKEKYNAENELEQKLNYFN
jgi:hypothetical protein